MFHAFSSPRLLKLFPDALLPVIIEAFLHPNTHGCRVARDALRRLRPNLPPAVVHILERISQEDAADMTQCSISHRTAAYILMGLKESSFCMGSQMCQCLLHRTLGGLAVVAALRIDGMVAAADDGHRQRLGAVDVCEGL